MRVLVGTLHSEENELEACRQAIAGQRGVDFEHFVISGLPNREAHEALYRRFMERAADFDCFVKVDADMVLTREDLLLRIAERLRDRPEIDQLEIAVHDFFTDGLVFGLNAFRSGVRFPPRPEGLFVDSTPVRGRQIERDRSELAPAALHCPDPSPFQAFHFGLHKALKWSEAEGSGQRERALRHRSNVERTWAQLRRREDRRLLLACLGAELALAGRLDGARVDYADAATRRLFDAWRGRGDAELRARAEALRATRRGASRGPGPGQRLGRRVAAWQRRRRGQALLRRVRAAVDWEAFERVRAAHQQPDADPLGPNKYFDHERFLRLNVERAVELGLDRSPPQRILDLGCGVGWLLFVARQLGHDALGLDFDVAMGNGADTAHFGPLLEVFGARRALHEIVRFEKLPDLGRFDLVTAYQIRFNRPNKPDKWGVPEWRFFLADLKTHLAPRGRVELNFNQTRATGEIHSPELLDEWDALGAEIQGGNVRFPSAELLPD